MMIERVEFKGVGYPGWQAEGNAARWVMPWARHVCVGAGVDVGYGREEWKLPGAVGVDEAAGGDALALPVMVENGGWDYVFSSHCLEHVRAGVGEVLEHWHGRLRPGGVLCLYLPDCDRQVYWRPWHNRKHVHYLTPGLMRRYFEDMEGVMWERGRWWVGEADLNASFAVVAVKGGTTDGEGGGTTDGH